MENGVSDPDSGALSTHDRRRRERLADAVLAAPSEPQKSSERQEFVEPASRLPLRWGTQRIRWMLALALVLAGTGCVLLTSAYSIWFLLVGCLLQPIGWTLMPTTIGRRVAVVVPALLAAWVMLAGVAFGWVAAVILACWLWTRFRPAVAYVTLVLPVAASVILSRFVAAYSFNVVSDVVQLVVCVGAAWLARAVAAGVARRQAVRTLQANTADRG